MRAGAVGVRPGASEGTAVHGWAAHRLYGGVPRGRRLRTPAGVTLTAGETPVGDAGRSRSPVPLINTGV